VGLADVSADSDRSRLVVTVVLVAAFLTLVWLRQVGYRHS